MDSYSIEHNRNFDFWAQPGLFVYTTIGNLLLYRLCWAFNILIWSKYDINYISILHLKNIKPNQLVVINETATLLVFYFITLLIFFRVNVSYADANTTNTIAVEHPILSYGCPLLLLIVSILYLMYEFLYLFGNHTSHGIFNMEVITHCFQAAFVSSTFRDTFAADVLTSFTRIIADSINASCWIISGSFLQLDDTIQNFGTSSMQCTGYNMIYIVSIIQMIPLFIRTLQCIRGMIDDNYNSYPLGYNSMKYMLSVLVVVLGLTVGNNTNNNSNNIIIYYFFIVLSILYKWWWDVTMDWGMFDVMPKPLDCKSNHSISCCNKTGCCTIESMKDNGILPRYKQQTITEKPSNGIIINNLITYFQLLKNIIKLILKSKIFLRSSLMFPSISLYYLCIILDLILRFLWVLSLLPSTTLPKEFVGYQLSFFLGSMEILRRCMWATLRVEYEHLKMLKKKTPGFLNNRIMRKEEDLLFISGNESVGERLSLRKHSNLVIDDEMVDGDDDGNGDVDNDGYDSDIGVGIRLRNLRSKHRISLHLTDHSDGDGDQENKHESEIDNNDDVIKGRHVLKRNDIDDVNDVDIEVSGHRPSWNNEEYSPVGNRSSRDREDSSTGDISSRRLRLFHKKSVFDLPPDLVIDSDMDSADKINEELIQTSVHST